MRVSFELNGEPCTVDIKPHWTLLKVLRDVVGLTGTKEGCGAGQCGACSVLLDGRPIRACLMFAGQVEQRRLLTIEGLARGAELHPLQTAFIEQGALQCGFCVPGMLLVASAVLAATPDAAESELRRSLAGNLCRCTGYVKPIEAVLRAAEILRNERGR